MQILIRRPRWPLDRLGHRCLQPESRHKSTTQYTVSVEKLVGHIAAFAITDEARLKLFGWLEVESLMIPSILAVASDTDWAIITDLVVILVSAAVVAVVMQRMRLAAIPAYLIAGAVVGCRSCHAPHDMGS